jgi:hypothetical protein
MTESKMRMKGRSEKMEIRMILKVMMKLILI